MRFVILMTLSVFALSCTEAETVPQSLNVETGPLVFEGDYLGEFHAVNKVPIHAPNIPRVHSMTIEEVKEDGTNVKKGDVVLTFVKDSFESDLVDKQNSLDVATAEKRKVGQDLERERINLQLTVKRRELELERAKLQVVKGVNFISELELQKAQLEADKAQIELDLAKKALKTFRQKRSTAMKVQTLKVEAAEREVEQRKSGLDLVEVTAPVDGVVFAPRTRLNWSRTKAAAGVVARPGDKVLELPDLSTFELHAYVRQRDATLINVGDEAFVTPTILPDVEIKGTVKKKNDFATTRNTRLGTETPDGNLKEYLIVIELESSPEEIRPGNTGTVKIRSQLAESVTLLPVASVYEKERKNLVRMADGQERELKLGRTNLTHVEVVEGVKPGDKVVVEPTSAPPIP